MVRSDVHPTAPHKNRVRLTPAINLVRPSLKLVFIDFDQMPGRGALVRLALVFGVSRCARLLFRCDYGVHCRCGVGVGLFNIAAEVNGPRKQSHPIVARTVRVEVQRHLPLAKEALAAKDVSPVVATAKADTKKIKHYKPKVFARQRDNYGYWNAPGYAQRGLFFR